MKSRYPCLLLAMLLVAPATLATQLKDVRLWRAPDHTRVVFDLNAAPNYKLITLESPHRIVVDTAGEVV